MRSSKKIRNAVVAAIVIAAVIVFLNLALYPCTFMRNDVHTISTQQRDVLVMGTSCGKMGIDPESLLQGSEKSGHNLCVGGHRPHPAGLWPATFPRGEGFWSALRSTLHTPHSTLHS